MANKPIDTLKKPSVLAVLTHGELRLLRIIAARKDIGVKQLAEKIVKQWIKDNAETNES